jgi:hypothetical protein
LIAIDANHSVKKLTGHDNVFNIHLMGELKTRNTNQSIRNIQIKLIIEFSTVGFEKVNFIHNEK